jgi:hypothetical protein
LKRRCYLPATGFQDIKWIEMHDKWGHYIPVEEKKKWKYYNEKPPTEVYEKVRKQGKAAKKQRQDRTRTVQYDTKKPPKKVKKKSPKEDITTTGVI